jgi:Methyltransferase domain
MKSIITMDLLNNIHIKYIEGILQQVGERVEGNLVCDINPTNYVLSRNIDKVKNLQFLCKGKRRICEIGVNACHSLLIMLLENPSAEYLIFDLNNHRYTEPCMQYIRAAFPTANIKTVYGNSIETVRRYIHEHADELHTYDLCHIDGGHTPDIFTADYENIRYLSKKGSPVIFDDYDMGDIRRFIDAKVAAKDIAEYECTGLVKTMYHFIFWYV